MKGNDLSSKVNFIFITKGLKILKYLSNEGEHLNFCELPSEVMSDCLLLIYFPTFLLVLLCDK
jgi:hypothetical protein